MSKVKINSFKATGTSGRIYTVEVWQTQLNVGGFGDPGATTGGMASLITTCGQHLNYVSKGHYRTVFGNEELTSTDPNAA